MVAPVEKERHAKNRSEVSTPPLNRSKVELKRQPAAQQESGNWIYRLLLSGCLFLTWCFINGLIMVGTKAYNWQKSHVSVKEMKVSQLQANIARRLSELARISMKQPSSPPILLSVDTSNKAKPTLLGRR